MDSSVADSIDAILKRAAHLIQKADAILIGTGAGMGVGSGLGTFRGRYAGVWPPLERLKMDFTRMSNPSWFHSQPNFAWAFWHFRYMAYTGATPHEGYKILKAMGDKVKFGAFSFTSNIDGHWLSCGFPEERVVECHGSVRYMQCNSCVEISPTSHQEISNLQLADGKDDFINDPLPKCPKCNKLLRPNVMMFGDLEFDERRLSVQETNYSKWLAEIKAQGGNLVVIELGAGKAVPTVRLECQTVARRFNTALIRINLDDSETDNENYLSIPLGANEALTKIVQHLVHEYSWDFPQLEGTATATATTTATVPATTTATIDTAGS